MSDAPPIWIHDRWHRCHQAPGLSMVQKAVLVAIAAHSDERWEAYPSETTLAEYAGCSDRAVRDAVKALEARGLLTLTRRAGFNTRYRINEAVLPARREANMPPQGAPTATPRNHVPHPPEPDAGGRGGHPPERGSTPPGTPFQTPRNLTPDPPEPGSAEGTKEGSSQGTSEGTSEGTTHTAPAGAPRASAAILADLWARLVAFTPKPGAWKLTDARRKHLRSRLDEHGAEAVERVADWVRTSTHDRARFLRERGDPDTLLRPEKFATYLGMAEQPAGPHRARDAPTGRLVGLDLHAAAEALLDGTPEPRPGSIDVPFREVS